MLRGATLVGCGRWSASHSAARRALPPRIARLPLTEEDSGAAYCVLRRFGARLTDPFGATRAPGLHHPRIAPPMRGGAYSLRSSSLHSSLAGGL